jgi:hypothetical protein
MQPSSILRWLCLFVMLALALPAATTAADLRARDASATNVGRALLMQTAQRFGLRGLQTSNLRVWKDGAGYLVAPAGTRFRVSINESGAEILQPLSASPHGKVASGRAQAAAASSGWNLVSDMCFARISDSYSYMDHCYQLHKLSGDGSTAYDYYGLQRYATFGAAMPYSRVRSAMIAADAITNQTWVDWDPRGDRTGNCVNSTLSVAAKGFGLSWDVEKCEHWNMTKSNPAVKFVLTWTGNVHADRELAFEIAVRVNQGAWPQWQVGANVAGSPTIF